MRSILIPVDGSLPSKRAVKYAISLNKEGLKLDVFLLNVQPDVLPVGDLPLIDIELIDKYRVEHARKILRASCRLLKKYGITCHQEILNGSIPETIVSYSSLHCCDNIIMGTRGMGTIANVVLGSTANQVIHLTKIPITLIK